MKQLNTEDRPKPTHAVRVLEFDGKLSFIRFMTEDSAKLAVSLLAKQWNVLIATCHPIVWL